ncbi:SulP family inorganic anion transporter [Kocuria sp. M1R5S2]|uniref:SulP family inorganic anion transporter n=1 Tax=Kocuria rhizosphaerae TaxID=3376285 RepID=UPI0037B79A2F
MLGTLKSPRRPRTEVLAGLVVALALIPEAIAFSLIAGVDPQIGLFAASIMAVSIAFLGGRPAVISGATAATALVMAPPMASHGLDHFIAAVILAGIFQVVLALIGATRLMRFIPRSVMVGCVNALAILILTSDLPELIGVLVLVPAVALGPVVAMIPMAALVAVMIFVSWATVDRHSARPTTLTRMPRSETTVMVATVVVTVWTHNLAIGVIVGVVVAMVAFARRVAHLVTVAALDSVTDKHAHYGKDVEIAGLDQAGRRMRVRLGDCSTPAATRIAGTGAGSHLRAGPAPVPRPSPAIDPNRLSTP